MSRYFVALCSSHACSETIRRQLGNRLKVASSGGAAISAEVLHFARSVLRIDIVDLYATLQFATKDSQQLA
jgi:hypothetical protein